MQVVQEKLLNAAMEEIRNSSLSAIEKLRAYKKLLSELTEDLYSSSALSRVEKN